MSGGLRASAFLFPQNIFGKCIDASLHSDYNISNSAERVITMTVRELRKALFDLQNQDAEITLEQISEIMSAPIKSLD